MSELHYVCLEGLDKAVSKMSELGDVCGDTYGFVMGWAEEHTVDAVEVVRCKDCKHFRSETFKSGTVATWCHRHSGWDYEQDVKPYDYCSDGERREDGRHNFNAKQSSVRRGLG